MTQQSANQKLLRQAIDKLPRQAQPTRDLWPGIDFAINAPTPVRWHHYSALAASVFLILFSSMYFGRTQPSASIDNSNKQLILSLTSQHLDIKKSLLVEYQDQTPLYRDWQVELQQLEQAEQVIYNALREDPENLELIKILRQVQNKQLKFIDNVFSPRFSSI